VWPANFLYCLLHFVPYSCAFINVAELDDNDEDGEDDLQDALDEFAALDSADAEEKEDLEEELLVAQFQASCIDPSTAATALAGLSEEAAAAIRAEAAASIASSSASTSPAQKVRKEVDA
jgi:hypothetical protein